MKNQMTQATRNRCKIKMALQGPSGSGKTYSALLLAYGITGDWSKVGVLDSENGSAHLYSHLGNYLVRSMTPPFTPEEYIAAIKQAEENGVECLIIDSLSAEWSGQGGVLDIHSNIPGNSFAAWAKITPRHNAFIQAILQSNMRVIGTMRSKTDYVLSEKNGKQVPEKVGLKAVQREDSEYEFTIVMELTQKHFAMVTKDRTGIFKDKPDLVIDSTTGEMIRNWCNVTPILSEKVISEQKPKTQKEIIKTADFNNDPFEELIESCESLKSLKQLYHENPDLQNRYRECFIDKSNKIANIKTFSTNGKHN